MEVAILGRCGGPCNLEIGKDFKGETRAESCPECIAQPYIAVVRFSSFSGSSPLAQGEKSCVSGNRRGYLENACTMPMMPVSGSWGHL